MTSEQQPMAPRPSVLVFDVNETLVDIESLTPLFTEMFGDEGVLREWFAQLVMYSMSATLADSYVNFSTLAQGVLHMVGDIHHVDVSDEQVVPTTVTHRVHPVADGRRPR